MSTTVKEARQGRLAHAVLAVTILGVLVSAYLVYEHFTSATTFACPGSGAVDCVKVTTSAYATFLGFPVAVLGLAFFTAMTAMSLPRAWREPALGRVRLASAALGVVFVLYLMWTELFRINAICLWCTLVHVLTFLLFALLAVDAALDPTRADHRAGH